MRKKRRTSKPQFKDVVIDLPPKVMSDLRCQAAQFREKHGIKLPISLIIKARIAQALADSAYKEAIENIQVVMK